MLIALIIAAVLIAAAFVGLYAAYYKTFYSPYKGAAETDIPNALKKHPYREISVANMYRLYEAPCDFFETRSYDGLKLCARFFEGDPDKPVCICFHGYRGSSVRDFSGCGLYLIESGYNVIMVDERACWRSEGHTMTFGIKERHDVLTWVEFANKRFGSDKPVFIFGISMGGGTVLMASSADMPDNVRCIIADCPFNAPMDIILHVCEMLKMKPALCRLPVQLAARIYGNFNIYETTAADEVKKAKKPIMIIHGEGDGFVPMYMSKQVYEANPDMVEWYTFPEAGHGLSYYYDTERYKSLVDNFMKKHS